MGAVLCPQSSMGLAGMGISGDRGGDGGVIPVHPRPRCHLELHRLESTPRNRLVEDQKPSGPRDCSTPPKLDAIITPLCHCLITLSSFVPIDLVVDPHTVKVTFVVCLGQLSCHRHARFGSCLMHTSLSTLTSWPHGPPSTTMRTLVLSCCRPMHVCSAANFLRSLSTLLDQSKLISPRVLNSILVTTIIDLNVFLEVEI